MSGLVSASVIIYFQILYIFLKFFFVIHYYSSYSFERSNKTVFVLREKSLLVPVSFFLSWKKSYSLKNGTHSQESKYTGDDMIKMLDFSIDHIFIQLLLWYTWYMSTDIRYSKGYLLTMHNYLPTSYLTDIKQNSYNIFSKTCKYRGDVIYPICLEKTLT